MSPSTDDQVLYIAKLHLIIFVWPVIFSVIALVMGVVFPQFKTFFYILFIFGLLWGAQTWTEWYFTDLIIKTRHIILKTGFFTRQIVDIPMSKIERVDIRQTMTGTLFHYGSLLITGTGGSRLGIHRLKNPLTSRRHIEQLLANLQA